MAFLRENWLALASLAVALIGGVPGITAILEYVRRRARFGAEIAGYVSGNVRRDDGVELTMLLLTMTVWNKGDRPLTPASFQLSLRMGKKWIAMEPWLMSRNAVYESDVQEIRVAERDLQRFTGSVTPATPVHGHAMFVTDKVTLAQVREAHQLDVRLVCRDVFGRDHRLFLPLPRDPIKGPLEYPKHGLAVRPKSGDAQGVPPEPSIQGNTMKTTVLKNAPGRNAYVLAPKEAPAIRGDGTIRVECGSCGILLVDGLGGAVKIKGLILKCPNCGAYSTIPDLDSTDK